MSRIGKLPIDIPAGVEIKIDDQLVTVKGKLGELKQQLDEAVNVKVEANQVILERQSDAIDHRAKHGLYRALIQNMVKGVSEGFEVVQEFVGVGYKAEAKGQLLEMALGYSHNIVFEIPAEVKIETITERGKNPILKMRSHDKQLLGQVAAKIRSLRKPEPYKGKGIRFQGEVLRRKAGKAAGK
ncbi:MAG: 50S ribosomal protein L6 [Bacteroidales bacterium]|jgi:large subunit ribosomal protein L6|nr:50S ribosomal protein L6 [Bacteroidales bacterium]MDD4086407.1 50S ribosomal protein L6 [Bacteroidales bacterium]MDY0085881.1 50S ribosomal protein L6 [Bacteroidales bacterium]